MEFSELLHALLAATLVDLLGGWSSRPRVGSARPSTSPTILIGLDIAITPSTAGAGFVTPTPSDLSSALRSDRPVGKTAGPSRKRNWRRNPGKCLKRHPRVPGIPRNHRCPRSPAAAEANLGGDLPGLRQLSLQQTLQIGNRLSGDRRPRRRSERLLDLAICFLLGLIAGAMLAYSASRSRAGSNALLTSPRHPASDHRRGCRASESSPARLAPVWET